MRVYEELFIVKPDTAEEEVDGIRRTDPACDHQRKGHVDKTDKWGVRKLAYRVQKYTKACTC